MVGNMIIWNEVDRIKEHGVLLLIKKQISPFMQD